MDDGFRRFANTASRGLGTPFAFSIAVLVVVALRSFQAEFKKLRDEGHSETSAAVAARERRLGARHPKD